jgi:hypothetical protein
MMQSAMCDSAVSMVTANLTSNIGNARLYNEVGLRTCARATMIVGLHVQCFR